MTFRSNRRGFGLLGLVVSFLVLAGLSVVAATTWKLTSPAGSGGAPTRTEQITGDPTAVAGNPAAVVGAARGMVLNSYADAIVTELRDVAMMGDPVGAEEARAVAARFPVTVDAVTITATADAFAVNRTIRVSDGSATVCVAVPEAGAPSRAPC